MGEVICKYENKKSAFEKKNARSCTEIEKKSKSCLINIFLLFLSFDIISVKMSVEFVNKTYLQKVADPYGALGSLDIPSGLIFQEKRKVQPGNIVYFTFAGNRLIKINNKGDIVKKFANPVYKGEGYDFYRPCKPAVDKNGFVSTFTHNSDPKNKRSIGQVDRNGRVLWLTKPLPLSHDFHMVDNENIYAILRQNAEFNNISLSNNEIVQLDINGDIKWRWSLLEHMTEFNGFNELKKKILSKKTDNPFHINSIQYVGSDFIIKKFGEPIIVLSSRNMNLIFFVGKNTGTIVYQLENQTKGQHNANIIESGLPGENHLLIFDNQNDHPNRIKCGNSRIIEVDIETNRIIWSYKNKPDQPVFFTPIVGSAQRLQNGNTLICQGFYGRIFEVNREGDIVWDYVNPFVNYQANLEEQGPREIFTATKY